jgi:DNA processing protein
LSVQLDFRARDLSRFWSLLELPDPELIEAVGGRRRANLHSAYAEWEPAQTQVGEEVESLCRHHPAYPPSLCKDPLAPHTLSVRGGIERLLRMLGENVVAIVGTRRATDYGMETARTLARGLAASGVTVASGLAEGIPAAVHSGALEAGATTLTVTGGGVERSSPALYRALYRSIVSGGCAISENQSPTSPRVRGWWQPARARTLALLAQLVIVVEAGERPWELACARVARMRGRSVAAVPGRVSSPASKGANSLLMSGARLVRDPQDALDVLYGVGTHEARDAAVKPVALEPRLARVLERVGGGEDTIARLAARGAEPGDVAVALTELELRGWLLRGDGGRYVPCGGLSGRALKVRSTQRDVGRERTNR